MSTPPPLPKLHHPPLWQPVATSYHAILSITTVGNNAAIGGGHHDNTKTRWWLNGDRDGARFALLPAAMEPLAAFMCRSLARGGLWAPVNSCWCDWVDRKVYRQRRRRDGWQRGEGETYFHGVINNRCLGLIQGKSNWKNIRFLFWWKQSEMGGGGGGGGKDGGKCLSWIITVEGK